MVINIIPEGGAHGSFFVFTPLYGRYRKVQLGRGGDAGSGPRGIGPDSMSLRRSLSVDHIVNSVCRRNVEPSLPNEGGEGFDEIKSVGKGLMFALVGDGAGVRGRVCGRCVGLRCCSCVHCRGLAAFAFAEGDGLQLGAIGNGAGRGDVVDRRRCRG